jgi:peptidyl-prolyl cis-trans isomerase SurA
LISVCFSVVRGAEAELQNGIAVIVNQDIITIKDIRNALMDDIEFLERRYSSQPAVLDQKLKELQQSKTEELVELNLILQEWEEYKKKGANIPESFFENRLNEDIKKYGDRLRLTKTLQAEGTTFEQFRKRNRERIIVDLIMREKMPRDLVISPAKIEKYYLDNQDKFKLEDQVKLRMIVLTNRPSDTTYAPAKLAAEILAKVDEGASFADMAKIYSQGSQSVEGGSWGWVERSVLRADLAAAAFALKPGERSKVIEAKDGAYLMLVEETKLSHVKPLTEVRDEVESTLKVMEQKRLRKQFVERLKAKAYVRYFY